MPISDFLLPCPFCGSEPSLSNTFNGIETLYSIHCSNCHRAIVEGANSFNEALALWNTRYNSTNPSKALTIDELKNKTDTPVYILDMEQPEYSCWAIIGEIHPEGFVDLITKYCNKYYIDCGAFDLYGKTWIAYERKP